jgi:hypothetical protein
MTYGNPKDIFSVGYFCISLFRPLLFRGGRKTVLPQFLAALSIFL